MDIERRVLKSVSEFSMFKYLLFIYLIFFLLWVIVIILVGLITWLGLSSYGLDITSIMESFGLENTNVLLGSLGGGTALAIGVLIAGGLVGAVISACVGTIGVWIMNVILKMSGGIELRFLPEKKS
jgi:hypothetical protein